MSAEDVGLLDLVSLGLLVLTCYVGCKSGYAFVIRALGSVLISCFILLLSGKAALWVELSANWPAQVRPCIAFLRLGSNDGHPNPAQVLVFAIVITFVNGALEVGAAAERATDALHAAKVLQKKQKAELASSKKAK